MCMCGEIVAELARDKHICTVAARRSSKPRPTNASDDDYECGSAGSAAAGSAGSVVKPLDSATIAANEAKHKKLLAEAKRIRELERERIDLSKAKILRSLNWELEFGHRDQLLICLQRRGKDGNPVTKDGLPVIVKFPVIEDPDLPINTYRFKADDGKHYIFEFFM
jgi:hypothetical protein